MAAFSREKRVKDGNSKFWDMFLVDIYTLLEHILFYTEFIV